MHPSLKQAVLAYLRFHDANLGDDYFDADRRAVRLPLDAALAERSVPSSIHDLTPWERALVEAAYDHGYSVGDSDGMACANDCTPTGGRDDAEIIAEAVRSHPQGRNAT